MGLSFTIGVRDELGDRGQLGSDVGGQVDVGQARVRRGKLCASAQSLPPAATTRRPTGQERSVLPLRGKQEEENTV
jgi:hypothetical protein